MLSPSNPEQKDNSKVIHDGMDDAGHEAQFGHANSGDGENIDKDRAEDAKKDEKVDREVNEREEDESDEDEK